MNQFKNLVEDAYNSFRTADHLAYVSYPLLKDKRLLLAITQNLYMAGVKCVDALLYYEKLYKRLNIVPAEFSSRMYILRKTIAPRYKIKGSVVNIVNDLHLLDKQHKESPMEFSRSNKFVMCSEDYSSVKTIDIGMLKNYIGEIRNFLEVLKNLK